MSQIQKSEANTLTKPKGNLGKKLIWTTILIGIPVGILYAINLPYPAIRRPVAKVAPFLLIPSQISIDSNFKQSITLITQAEQLIDRPTSMADLDLGQEKLKEGKEKLNAIPLSSGDEWSGSNYGWYYWSFSWHGFQQLRGRVGQLEAKVFQEKNAQTLLVDSDLALNTAKAQYRQAGTPADKRVAIASWQEAINQLQQIPSVTLAGKTAQQKVTVYQQQFKEEVGLAAGNEKVNTLISASQQFSRRAAEAGRNPPHTVQEWLEIEKLWQSAIDELKGISSEDLEGYAKARELTAEYSTNIGQIRIRRQAEEDSVKTFEYAQSLTETLLNNTPSDGKYLDINGTIAQLQTIINELDKVQNGTTVYLKAQELKLNATNKLKELQTTQPK